MRRAVRGLATTAAATLLMSGAAQAAAGPTLRVGVGRADATSVTNVFKGGWACICARAYGQHTRLYFRAVVLEQGGEKLALVNADLALFGQGMLRDAVSLLPGRGFSPDNVIVSATHSHSSQAGYMNYATFNSALPKADDPDPSGTSAPTDPVMYSSMVRQLAAALDRADRDLAPGALGWGRFDLYGITANRSLEAELGDYGVEEEPGQGSTDQVPGGYRSTIDPAVDVLRVDKYVKRGRRTVRRPVGVFSTFANHGTIVRPTFEYLSGDHFATAERIVEAGIRKEGKVPGSQDVVNAFADGDAGDQTAALTRSGPADAEEVGRAEGAAMLTAWREAGRHMTRQPAFGRRYTVRAMADQATDEGPTDSEPVIGLAAAAGSEELRTVFFDEGIAREGARLAAPVGAQGYKVPTLREGGSVAPAVPMTVARVGSRLLATVPGEPTLGVGNMIRSAVEAQAGPGVDAVVVVGYANEYLDYFATPLEYDRQHYEGGFTMYGRTASLVIRDTLADLTKRLTAGEPAPAPTDYDANDGTHVSAAAYGGGAEQGIAREQPAASERLGHPTFSWSGGADGIDRPVDRAFVTVQRRTRRGGWRDVADDLGLQLLWRSDASGYTTQWEVPIFAAAGTYRFSVTAKRYALTSAPFAVTPGAILRPEVDAGQVRLHYPDARIDQDWTARPRAAFGGTVTFDADGRRLRTRSTGDTGYPVPSGTHVTIPAGGARDRYGNANAAPISVR